MPCHVIVLDTTGTTYTFYEQERKNATREKKEKEEARSVVPPLRM